MYFCTYSSAVKWRLPTKAMIGLSSPLDDTSAPFTVIDSAQICSAHFAQNSIQFCPQSFEGGGGGGAISKGGGAALFVLILSDLQNLARRQSIAGSFSHASKLNSLSERGLILFVLCVGIFRIVQALWSVLSVLSSRKHMWETNDSSHSHFVHSVVSKWLRNKESHEWLKC